MDPSNWRVLKKKDPDYQLNEARFRDYWVKFYVKFPEAIYHTLDKCGHGVHWILMGHLYVLV